MGDDGEDVAGVGDEHVDGAGGDAHEVWEEFFEDADVGSGEFHAGLVGFLACAGGDDDHVGVFEGFEFASADDVCFVGKHGAVGDVEGFCVGAFAVDVVEYDFAG